MEYLVVGAVLTAATLYAYTVFDDKIRGSLTEFFDAAAQKLGQ